jgi:DNA-binding response OmpR family regulator
LIGADDYLVKPLGATELLARIRRALTRANSCAGTRSRSPRSRL